MNRDQLLGWKGNLLKEIEELESKLLPLEREIKLRREKLSSVERLLNLESGSFELASSARSNSEVANRQKLSDIAYAVLQETNTPMFYRELYKAILKHGFNVPGQDPATNLIAHISKDPRFKRVKRGTYGLKGWRLKGRKLVRRRKRSK